MNLIGQVPTPPQETERLSDAIREPEEPIPWVWAERQLVAPGRPAILAAPGGLGKTWVALRMALSVGAGIPFFGQPPARVGRVIHISWEAGRRQTLRRLRKLCRGLGLEPHKLENVEFITVEKLGFRLSDPEAEEKMLALCEGAVLVTIDALLRSAPAYKENDAEISKPLELLNRVSAKTETAFVMIHHVRKGEGSATELLRGHSAIQNAVDAHLHLSEHDGGWLKLEAAKHTDAAGKPRGYLVRLVDTDDEGIVLEHRDAPIEEKKTDRTGNLDDMVALVRIIEARPGLLSKGDLSFQFENATGGKAKRLEVAICGLGDGLVRTKLPTQGAGHRYDIDRGLLPGNVNAKLAAEDLAGAAQ